MKKSRFFDSQIIAILKWKAQGQNAIKEADHADRVTFLEIAQIVRAHAVRGFAIVV